jgi:hypothetical protein
MLLVVAQTASHCRVELSVGKEARAHAVAAIRSHINAVQRRKENEVWMRSGEINA